MGTWWRHSGSDLSVILMPSVGGGGKQGHGSGACFDAGGNRARLKLPRSYDRCLLPVKLTMPVQMFNCGQHRLMWLRLWCGIGVPAIG